MSHLIRIPLTVLERYLVHRASLQETFHQDCRKRVPNLNSSITRLWLLFSKKGALLLQSLT
jgi:hypothetical protein